MKNTGRVFLIALLVLTATGALAEGNNRYGVRAGYTDWDGLQQAHVGLTAYLGELWPNIEFIPNVEFGFGDNTFITTVNGDVVYFFTEMVSYPWGLYGGGSLSFNIVDPDVGDTQTDLGLSGLVGTTYTLANRHKAMAEFRFGILDSPTFKITFGYTLF